MSAQFSQKSSHKRIMGTEIPTVRPSLGPNYYKKIVFELAA
jgi:hypothetical protein